MTLEARIGKAFERHQLPCTVVDLKNCLQFDSDVEDALWFTGRDWRELTKEDWETRHCGLNFFTAEALQYYLPSLLLLTMLDPENYPALALQSALYQLDRSPGLENLDPLTYRLVDLSVEELEVLKEWLVWSSENVQDAFFGKAVNGPGDGYGRVFDTIESLRQEAELRKMIAAENGDADAGRINPQ